MMSYGAQWAVIDPARRAVTAHFLSSERRNLMARRGATRTGEHGDVTPRAAMWLWLSGAAALLAIVGSVIALAVSSIYSGLTPAFLPQALAQDIANLALASPALLILAALALRGSLRAYLLWLGVLTFTVYNYVIYAFSIPFGPLFLLWVAVLGLCIYALIGGLTAVDHVAVAERFASRRAVTVVAWFLIVEAALFVALWLSQDVPALLAGTRPQSLVDMGTPTNPIHVLDLGFFLPAVIATGVLLLRRIPLAYTLAPMMIVFLLLTGVPILITPCLLYTSPSPRDRTRSRMPSSA